MDKRIQKRRLIILIVVICNNYQRYLRNTSKEYYDIIKKINLDQKSRKSQYQKKWSLLNFHLNHLNQRFCHNLKLSRRVRVEHIRYLKIYITTILMKFDFIWEVYQIINYIRQQMESNGAVIDPGDPVIQVQLQLGQKYCFVQFRSIEEIEAALQIETINYKGKQLKFKRVKDYKISSHIKGEREVPKIQPKGPAKNIFVCGLASDTDNEILANILIYQKNMGGWVLHFVNLKLIQKQWIEQQSYWRMLNCLLQHTIILLILQHQENNQHLNLNYNKLIKRKQVVLQLELKILKMIMNIILLLKIKKKKLKKKIGRLYVWFYQERRMVILKKQKGFCQI
ncbi:unnamed protein product [Paramecium primaurelia]|uniref:RRM domain-containing protein n=1 Tax=Paramecium primaurelia TaxID=5886 RepID=A0A8S1QT12_PARPR|nr:unnamed protein product [Paramecium primaurelia]